MNDYRWRSLVFSLGATFTLGIMLPLLPSTAETLLRNFCIQVGLFIAGLAIFYKPKVCIK